MNITRNNLTIGIHGQNHKKNLIFVLKTVSMGQSQCKAVLTNSAAEGMWYEVTMII